MSDRPPRPYEQDGDIRLDLGIRFRENIIMGKGKGVLFVCLLFEFLFHQVGEARQIDQTRKREAMVKHQLAGRDITDVRVLDAMRAVPRHLFVPEHLRPWAYADHPLPIGEEQTISQPYIVALMTQLLDVKAEDKVLEIGTGSGYQAAVLAHLADRIYSIEINPKLAEKAARRLEMLGYGKIRLKSADGYAGWEEHAPYDAIIITCASPEVPAALFRQLREGGRIVMPKGTPQGRQILCVITKIKGKPLVENITAVRFVPMVRRKIPDSEDDSLEMSYWISNDSDSAAPILRSWAGGDCAQGGEAF